MHAWNLSPEEAAPIQTEVRTRLVLIWDNRPVTTIGGIDVSIKSETTRAAIVALSYPDLTLLESVLADTPLIFPAIPGHLMAVETATEFVLACCRGYRLPEPTRWAHKAAGGKSFRLKILVSPECFEKEGNIIAQDRVSNRGCWPLL